MSGSGLVEQAVPRGLEGARAEKAESGPTSATRPPRRLSEALVGPPGACVGCFCNCAGASLRQQPPPRGQVHLAWGRGSSAGQNVRLCGASHGGADRSQKMTVDCLSWSSGGPSTILAPTRCPGSILYTLGNVK